MAQALGVNCCWTERRTNSRQQEAKHWGRSLIGSLVGVGWSQLRNRHRQQVKQGRETLIRRSLFVSFPCARDGIPKNQQANRPRQHAKPAEETEEAQPVCILRYGFASCFASCFRTLFAPSVGGKKESDVAGAIMWAAMAGAMCETMVAQPVWEFGTVEWSQQANRHRQQVKQPRKLSCDTACVQLPLRLRLLFRLSFPYLLVHSAGGRKETAAAWTIVSTMWGAPGGSDVWSDDGAACLEVRHSGMEC